MKKILTFLCSVGLLFSMAACSSGNKVDDKALDALEKGINKIVEMKTATYSLGLDATVDEDKAIVKLSGGYLADTAKPSFTAVMDMESQGSKMDGIMKFFMKDNAIYMEMLTKKQKISLDEAENTGIVPSNMDEVKDFKMNKKEIKQYLKKATLSGDTLTIELDPEKMTEEIKKNAGDSIASSAADTTYEKFNLTATIKDDFITNAVLDFEGTQKDKTTSETQKLKGIITLDFSDINAGKELTFPDLSEYKESAE